MAALLSVSHIHKATLLIGFRSWTRLKYTLDYSLLPTIQEKDLKETFVRGSGPGGSAVNKNSNCVVLTHIPSGTVVKCHLSRDLQENRKLARKVLITKLDDAINGDKSITSQKKAIAMHRGLNALKKKQKLNHLKETWRAKFLTNDEN